MRTVTVAFILAALISAVLTPLVRDLACRYGWLDEARSSRKVHGKPIPRLGGIAIALGFYAPLVGLLVVDSATGAQFRADQSRVLGLFLGGAAIVLLGIYDDLRGSGAAKKLVVQAVVAYAVYRLGFRVDQITNPFGPAIQLGWLGLPFTLLWIVGVVNAMNLIDGLDGLAGGVALIAVGTTFLTALQGGNPMMLLFTASLAGAILGFLRFNFNPASIFMGDTGSMFLGFVLATASIQTHQKSSTTVAMLIPIVTLGLPIGDTLLAVVRRALRGVPVFHSDRGHIHHRLMAKGLSQRQVVGVLYGVCLLLGAAALALTRASGMAAAMVLLAVATFTVGLLYWVGYIHWRDAGQVVEVRKHNLQLRTAIHEIGKKLQEAEQPYEVWKSVRIAAGILGASCVELELTHHNGVERTTNSFSLGFDQANADLLRGRYDFISTDPEGGRLELGWSDGRAVVDRDTEIAVELLCQHLLTAKNRICLEREQEETLPIKKVVWGS